jgi:SAM-dependent methyltransferase
MAINVQRTHDHKIYLNEDRYAEPVVKEIHKTLASNAIESGVLQNGSIVCDFGCATGEFEYHLSSRFPDAEYHGYDVVPELVNKARQMVPNGVFEEGSVLNEKLLAPNFADISFMIGVHAGFDDFVPSFSNLINWTKKGGRIYVFGPFNPYPVDVWAVCRRADDSDPTHREPGWNIFSKATVGQFLDEAVGKGNYEFRAFEMPFDLPPHADDPLRSWTFLDQQGRRQLTSGLGLTFPMEFLEIRP